MQEHRLIVSGYREDHKRGWAAGRCECGWAAPFERARFNMDGPDYEAAYALLTKWREHLPADHQPAFGTCVDDDGSIHTGQAFVSLEGEDYVFNALSTHLTQTGLVLRGFHHGNVGELEQADEVIIPVSRVREVRSTPWWDRDEIIFETAEEEPAEAAQERDRYESE